MVNTASHQSQVTLQQAAALKLNSTDTTLLVGTANGLWILDAEPRVELEGDSIDAIATSDNGLWAIVNRNSIWQRQENWRQIAVIEDLRLNCIQPVDQAVLVGTSEAHLIQISVDGSIQRIDSFDRAEGRQDWYTPWGGLPDVRSIAVGSEGELYVNIHVGGILRSRDGNSWQPTLDIHADVHEVRTVADRPGWVIAAAAEGLAVSQDGGDSWSFDRSHLHATYARAVAVADDQILISASVGPSGKQACLYRRQIDSPGTFEKCDRGLPDWFSDNINTKCLATSGSTAAFGVQNQIFRSTDAGSTWNRVVADLPSIRCLSFV